LLTINLALPYYEEQMIDHAHKLERIIRIAAEEGNTVLWNSHAYWFSFDIMGIFALSKSFNMLENENWHYAVTNLRRAMRLLGPLSPVPWLAQIGFVFLKGYWVIKDWHSMTEWCRDQMNECIHVSDTHIFCKVH
jgi:hypothetical protein